MNDDTVGTVVSIVTLLRLVDVCVIVSLRVVVDTAWML